MSKDKKIMTPADRILEQQKQTEKIYQAQNIAIRMTPALAQAMQTTILSEIDSTQFARIQMALNDNSIAKMTSQVVEVLERIPLPLKNGGTFSQIVAMLSEYQLHQSTPLMGHNISQAIQALRQATASITGIQNEARYNADILTKYLVVDSFQENTKMDFTEQLLDTLEPYVEEVEKRSKKQSEKQVKEFVSEDIDNEALVLQRQGNQIANRSLIVSIIALILGLLQFFNDDPQVKIEIHNHINQVIINHSDYDSYDVDLEKLMDSEMDDFSGGEKS